jgi:hypothetical protein
VSFLRDRLFFLAPPPQPKLMPHYLSPFSVAHFRESYREQ